MDFGVWLAFLGASILLAVMPGPDILFVAAQSASVSRKEGAAVALGLCTGLLGHITAAALGVSAVVYSYEAAFQAVKWLGAAYLFYLAFLAVRSAVKPGNGEAAKDGDDDDAASRQPSSFGRMYRRGILMNLLNPKVSLFFLALLPQFVVKDGFPVPVQMILLGLTFLASSLVVFLTVAFTAGSIGRRWIRGAAGHRATAWVQAIIYAGLGAQLLLSHG
jgi:threonine/homoserine/homoserine lactone efflux protein